MTFIVYYSATLYQKDGERMPIKVGAIWYNRKAKDAKKQGLEIPRMRKFAGNLPTGIPIEVGG